MARTLTAPAEFNFPDFGSVHVTPRHGMKRIILRRTPSGSYNASAAFGTPLDLLSRTLAEMLPKLAAKAPIPDTSRLSPGYRFTYPEGELRVLIGADRPNAISVRPNHCDIELHIGASLDCSNPRVAAVCSRGILSCARLLAPALIIPFAQECAERLGIDRINWEIGRATTQFGCCYRHGRRIRLSAIMLFLPLELRRFIIHHELAHLTHHDHSAAFHALCNQYCNGRERQLDKALKSFRLPPLS